MAILANCSLLLGDSLTFASRDDHFSDCRLAAHVIKDNLSKFLGSSGNADDAICATSLLDFLTSCGLPDLLRSYDLDYAEARRELLDSCRYTFGTAAERAAVETSRIHFATGFASRRQIQV